jgi:hypothetical protein
MVDCAALSYAAADFALSLEDREQMQVEQIRDHFMNIARKHLIAEINREPHQKEDIVRIACAVYLLLSCAVLTLF